MSHPDYGVVEWSGPIDTSEKVSLKDVIFFDRGALHRGIFRLTSFITGGRIFDRSRRCQWQDFQVAAFIHETSRHSFAKRTVTRVSGLAISEHPH